MNIINSKLKIILKISTTLIVSKINKSHKILYYDICKYLWVNSLGVIPFTFLKARIKVKREENPTFSPIASNVNNRFSEFFNN